MQVVAVLVAAACFSLSVEAQNVICGPKTTTKSVTVEDKKTYSFKTQKGKKYKGGTTCTVDYKMGDSCTKMSFVCNKFNTNNKDKKKCTKGDKVTVTVNGKPKVYCKTKKPKVFSTGDMSVVFESDKKKHGPGAVCKVKCTEAATSATTEGTASTTAVPAPNPCENSGCSVQTYYGTSDTLSLFTKNIFAIWWDPAHDHSADAEPLADILISVRDDCLSNLGLMDPPNPGRGFYYNVYIHHGEDDLFPSGWAMGQGTDPFGLPYLTMHFSGLFSQTLYHEGFHIFQYAANSPGFAYAGDSQWFIETSAQWYTVKKFREERNMFMQAGAILANPQLALWHSFGNHGPNDPASNEGRPGWMYGVRQYGMHTYLTFLTEVAGMDRKFITDGFYASTDLTPQEYLFANVGAEKMRELFADWAAHNTGGMDYLTKDQLDRAYLEITLAGDWDYYRPYVWSAVDEGTGGDWFTPPPDLTARGWAYNVFNINTTQSATYSFELEGDSTGSQGATSFFVGRVVRMSKNGPIYSDMTMTSPLSGTATVAVKAKDSSVFLVVASVPEFFTSYQHYSYKVKITKQ